MATTNFSSDKTVILVGLLGPSFGRVKIDELLVKDFYKEDFREMVVKLSPDLDVPVGIQIMRTPGVPVGLSPLWLGWDPLA